MPIKNNGETVNINIWPFHPLLITGIELLPAKVLDQLVPGMKTKRGILTLSFVPNECVDSLINYKISSMRKVLDTVQLKNKIITTFMCIVLAWIMGSALYYLNSGGLLTGLIGMLTVVVMASLFDRRFMNITRQDRALQHIYVYLIKEHQYMHTRLANELKDVNTRLAEGFDDFTAKSVALAQERGKLDKTRDDYEKDLEDTIATYKHHYNNLLSIYQDLVSVSEADVIIEHYHRCEKYGLTLETGEEYISPTDTIH